MNEDKTRFLVLVGTDDFLEVGLTLTEMRKKALQFAAKEGESMAICEVISVASVSRNAKFVDMAQVDLNHLP